MLCSLPERTRRLYPARSGAHEVPLAVLCDVRPWMVLREHAVTRTHHISRFKLRLQLVLNTCRGRDDIPCSSHALPRAAQARSSPEVKRHSNGLAAGGCSSCFIDQSVLWNAQASDGKLRPAMHKHHLSPEKANEGNLNGCSKPRVVYTRIHSKSVEDFCYTWEHMCVTSNHWHAKAEVPSEASGCRLGQDGRLLLQPSAPHAQAAPGS